MPLSPKQSGITVHSFSIFPLWRTSVFVRRLSQFVPVFYSDLSIPFVGVGVDPLLSYELVRSARGVVVVLFYAPYCLHFPPCNFALLSAPYGR